jgi:hypothetical protein
MVKDHTYTCDTPCRNVDTAPLMPQHFPQEPEAVHHNVHISLEPHIPSNA